MKIIAVDRYARPWISDVLICDIDFFDLLSGIIHLFNNDSKKGLLKWEDKHYKLVPDNYPLYDANNRFPHATFEKIKLEL